MEAHVPSLALHQDSLCLGLGAEKASNGLSHAPPQDRGSKGLTPKPQKPGHKASSDSDLPAETSFLTHPT